MQFPNNLLFALATVTSVVQGQVGSTTDSVPGCLDAVAGDLGCSLTNLNTLFPCICTSKFYQNAPLLLVAQNCPVSIVQPTLNALVQGCGSWPRTASVVNVKWFWGNRLHESETKGRKWEPSGKRP
ncbi:hypothetical protein BD410DRAFT_807541 [Rickenella mellea]|uniref:Extracellular membrane protein CFEM domain-containing protein n=1 Tax=Rickenella mellea TaxID=50990 RepID=A0A4Y7PNV0_9AGAM|nr:hypothetical protein BD410DRAFT_807541 [Rickenella mellea]